MQDPQELHSERAYTAHVQQLLYAVISQSQDMGVMHNETIRQLLTDAWEELRLKPTALSIKDIEQLSIDVNRYLARKAFHDNQIERSRKMLLSPFFARVDFAEGDAKEKEKIVIGLYSLRDENGAIAVHDWRAPICSLYYDESPGEVSYTCPDGRIYGTMSLKRQYKMEQGRLAYYVDTDVSIDDEMLLDILSGATSRHMRHIVTTIQKEQNAIIRLTKEPVVCVIGAAGSGKTSVALHRASYQLFHNRNALTAAQIAVISPSTAFNDYIANVLPDLGEECLVSKTMHSVMQSIIDAAVESPLAQNEIALTGHDQLRAHSIAYKASGRFQQEFADFVQKFSETGPAFSDIKLESHTLITKKLLQKMYREDFRLLNPAQRLLRIRSVLESRRRNWERALKAQYEKELSLSHHGKELEMMVRMAVSQRMLPVRTQIQKIVQVEPLALYAQAFRGDRLLYTAAKDNAQKRIVWWEDAGAVAWMLLSTGFAGKDSQIKELIIDEAQDYSQPMLSALHLRYAQAQVTILGDPSQRTAPVQTVCDPSQWGKCFLAEHAPIACLTRTYRSTMPISALLQAILPSSQTEFVGRDGPVPLCTVYDEDLLQRKLVSWKQEGMGSVAIITRTMQEAHALHRRFPTAMLLTHEDDMLPEDGQIVIACYHLLKGLEFDAVAVVWPDVPLEDDERRRLYTACSRALHDCCLLASEGIIDTLAIHHEDD